MLLRCLILSLLGLLALPNATGSCSFSKVDFATKEGRQQVTLAARDPIQCSRQGCGCPSEPCVVCFHAASGRCWTRRAPSLLVVRIRDLLHWINDSGPWIAQPAEWDSYIVGTSAIERPKALWPLNSVYRGRNMGSLGQQFDLTVESVVWTDAGPLGNIAGSFAHLGSTTKISVVANQGGKKLLDLSKPFTITMWIKTDNRTGTMALIDTKKKNNDYNFHFWFYSSNFQDQLYVNLPRRVWSRINKSDRLNWRHVACKHLGQSKFSFYLNGNEWPISHQEGPTPIHEISVMSIGRRPTFTEKLRFYGSMACVMIFDRALTADEIKNVRSLCG